MGREEEEEAAGEAGAQQHRSNPGSDQRRWGAHPRQVEGVQACSKHHKRFNDVLLERPGETYFAEAKQLKSKNKTCT